MNQCSREASKGRLAKLDTSRPRGPASGKSCKEQHESPRRVYETGNVPRISASLRTRASGLFCTGKFRCRVVVCCLAASCLEDLPDVSASRHLEQSCSVLLPILP